MKKALKWMVIAALTPIVLILILAALIYLPPVQNWAVEKVTDYASEQTGMNITVEGVNLDFPLDLGIDGLRATHLGDTIADIRHLTVDVRLLPLLRKKVVIDELSLIGGKVNTSSFLSDLQIVGEWRELWLASKGISLDKETVEVNGARLSDARLDIALSDTAQADTTKTDVRWKINADSLSIHKTDLTLHLLGDTLNLRAYMGKAIAREALIDLGATIYSVGSLEWRNGRLNWDNRFEPETAGFDANHISLTGISLKMDDVSYTPTRTAFYIGQMALKEKCGIEVIDLKGGFRMDSTQNNIQIPAMHVKTLDSDLFTEVDMDYNAFDEQNPGDMKIRMNGQIGKQDVVCFVGDLPQKFIERYPNHPISIKGSVDGNINSLQFTGLDVTLPSAGNFNVTGTAQGVMHPYHMKADLKLKAKTQDLSFMLALAAPSVLKNYRIPSGITMNGTLTANGTKYGADLTARESQGTMRLKGSATIPLDAKGEMNTSQMVYDADVSISNLNLHHFMPNDSLYNISAVMSAKGYGTDFLASQSKLEADISVSQLQFGHWDLRDMTAIVNLQNGHGQFDITGHNDLLDGTIGADMLISDKKIDGTVNIDLAKTDLYEMKLVDKPLAIGMSGTMEVSSDMKQTHRLSGRLGNLYIKDDKKTYTPDDIGLLIRTTRDTTIVRGQSGDFIVKIDLSENYEKLLKDFKVLSDFVMAQFDARVIDQPAIKRMLPTMKIHVESKRDNPIANLLKTRNIDFKELLFDMNTSAATGINGEGHIYSLNYDSTRIDTIKLALTQKGDRLTYQGQIRNNKRNPQFVFNALLDGHIHQHGAVIGVRYYNDKNQLGVRLGATADMEADGIRLRLMPERPTIAFKEFNLNKNNFIFLEQNKRIQAKVDLIADDKTGLKLYTENQDSTMLQDLTLSINRLDLGELTSAMPFLPSIAGKLNGDYHILQDQNEKFSVASDMAIQGLTHEGSYIGNISSEFVYMMKEDNTHAIEARLMLDEEEFGLLRGSYQNEGEGNVDAIFTMTHMPLSLANGYVPDHIVGLEGFGEGSLTIKGTTSHPQVDGEIYVEEAYLISKPYGIRMRFDNDPIRIVGSRLLLENFGLYAYNEEPLNMMGEVDFSNMDNITMDMRMRARNLQLINAKQETGSIAWGKAFVNFFARMQGPLEALNIRGKLDVLGSTDMTYMLLDSPLSTDNRLEELVKFTDFNDSTQVVVTRPKPTGLVADLNISIAQGAHIVCDLNTDQTNYVDLMGGGDLRMKYNAEGINLTGRYTLASGEMKYSLPVIPLKTFTVKEGSYVEFTGDPMNPKLNITATERTKATVGDESGKGRSVVFDCGVVITKTLNDMGLEFIIDAPEDQSVNGELETMSKEERGKVAVTMLTTGMYLNSGTTGSFSMNSALSSFLQSEINNIAGSALKTLDLSVGIDNTTDASGTMHTDYSFKFAKRFLNNRLKIELGGKVSSGSSYPGQNQSFFDNVTMEYRLNQEGTQNLKLFYNQNVYDWLDGYTGVYGVGFVWRRKLDNFWDIFRFWKKEEQPMMRQPQPSQQMFGTPRDSVKTDTINVMRNERK